MQDPIRTMPEAPGAKGIELRQRLELGPGGADGPELMYAHDQGVKLAVPRVAGRLPRFPWLELSPGIAGFNVKV